MTTLATATIPLGLSRDQWHRYVAHYPPAPPTGPLVGVTSVLKLQDVLIGGDLASWGGRIAATYLANNLPADGFSVGELVERSLLAVSSQRDIGTEAHAQIEKILLGQPVAPTERTAPYVYAFSGFMAAHRPEFLLTEAMIANLTAGYAGTFDFAAWLDQPGHKRKLALVDIKTGKLKASHRLQLAGYAAGEFVGVEGSTARKRIPRFDAYYVLLLTPDGYELVEQDVTAEDREHFLFLVDAYHRIRAWEKE